MKKIFGYSVVGDVRENEITLSAVFSSTMGPMKQDWLAKRSEDKIYVSITTALESGGNALGLIWMFGSVAPLDPEEEYAKQTKDKVEQFLRVGPDKCKLV